MNYENAGDILPEKLLQEVKKYAAGKLLYVPQDNHKKAWGEVSGHRQALVRRNQMMLNKFLNGTPVCELSKEYFLSEETVKRIVYSKKDTNKLDYHPTTNSAKAYSEAGMLEEWIHTYLLFGRAQGELELNCGNPLLEALKRSEVSEYPVILWITELADYAMHG
ncbi:CD3324 family protein [Paenibacillus sp. FSL K6-1217]|uniref:CD3324 family protein n=1 Tax=Paenibacillus sp. FSL K6-1217 TaxID=2921466 RepID=UPI0032474CED